MREYFVDTVAQAEAAARAIEEFLLEAQDDRICEDLPLDYLAAEQVRPALQFASGLVACLIRLRKSDEQKEKQDDDAQTP